MHLILRLFMNNVDESGYVFIDLPSWMYAEDYVFGRICTFLFIYTNSTMIYSVYKLHEQRLHETISA